jgi:hypothetical protein
MFLHTYMDGCPDKIRDARAPNCRGHVHGHARLERTIRASGDAFRRSASESSVHYPQENNVLPLPPVLSRPDTGFRFAINVVQPRRVKGLIAILSDDCVTRRNVPFFFFLFPDYTCLLFRALPATLRDHRFMDKGVRRPVSIRTTHYYFYVPTYRTKQKQYISVFH